MSQKTTLYIHIPFCSRKCYYCSFVIVVGQEAKADDYLEVLAIEADQYAGYDIEHVYIGGGTPSLLSPRQIEVLFSMIHRSFTISAEAEITLEANPEGLDCDRLAAMRSAGVTRLSLGVQTLNDDYLKQLGRIHRSAKVPEALAAIRRSGFNNVNCDLMFGFPGQTEDQLRQDIQGMLAFQTEHISLYSLTIDPRSRFHTDQVRIDAHQQARQYELIMEAMTSAGYRHYEVSNFARPGYESRHNLHYWEMGAYIGLGVGAHSFVDGIRFSNPASLGSYIKGVQADKLEREEINRLDDASQLAEAIAFGLRMIKGVDVGRLEQRYAVQLDDERQSALDQLVRQKLLEVDGQHYRVTRAGLMVLDEISARLI